MSRDRTRSPYAKARTLKRRLARMVKASAIAFLMHAF